MTRPIFTVAREDYGCPRCGQPKGKDCRSPSGRITDPPHSARVALAPKGVGAIQALRATDIFGKG